MSTIHLTTEEFREKGFDYTTKKDWAYQGELPAIIDFYADWCGHCKLRRGVYLKTFPDGRAVTEHLHIL